MFKKELIIGVLATFFLMGMLGTAFAENEAGSVQFSFDAQSMNHDAAINHDYNQEHLTSVGTEGGNWEFKFDTPETKADVAAKNYVYNQEHLASIGTEGGNWELKSRDTGTKANNANEAVAEKGNMKDAVCKGC